MHHWERDLGILYIDRKFTYEQFSSDDHKESIISRMSQLDQLTKENQVSIDRMFYEVENGEVIPVRSVFTPIAGPLGRMFNLAFSRSNLEETEGVNVTIKYAVMYNVFFEEFPQGSHCVLLISATRKSKLISSLPDEFVDDFEGIGFCDKINWKTIKSKLVESRAEYEMWKSKNAT